MMRFASSPFDLIVSRRARLNWPARLDFCGRRSVGHVWVTKGPWPDGDVVWRTAAGRREHSGPGRGRLPRVHSESAVAPLRVRRGRGRPGCGGSARRASTRSDSNQRIRPVPPVGPGAARRPKDQGMGSGRVAAWTPAPGDWDRPARGRLPPGHRAAAPSGAGPRARWPARARRAGEQTGGRWGSRAGPEHLDGLTGCGGAGGERRDASPPSHCVVGRMDVSNARDCAHSTRMAKGILPSDPRRSSRCHSAAHYPSNPNMAFDSQCGGAEW